MKLIVVILVVLLGIWLWRSRRAEERADRQAAEPRRQPPLALPNAMVRCEVCGLHVPEAEALTTPNGSFCSREHQRQAEPR